MRAASHTSGTRRGRPPAAFNPLELLAWWEGRGGRRPLSQRELARKLGLSDSTIRKHLRALRAAGELDDQARARNLAARGDFRRGGRPSTAINDTNLIAAWEAAHRRGKPPSVSGLARTLHVSRSRVRTRLQELGLLASEPPVHPAS
jgi:DNA-binding CsgD family transcriptional regulator